MRILFLSIVLILAGCSQSRYVYKKPQECTVVDTDNGAQVSCPDGTEVFIPDGNDGVDGSDGADGIDGSDGVDAVLLTKEILPAGSCTEVQPGIWAENISNGEIFDLYYNDQCSDSLGEYCDNIATIEGSTGSVNAGQGSGTICWIDNLQFSGVRLDNNDIEVYILDFN